jgi:hypothetical protein
LEDWLFGGLFKTTAKPQGFPSAREALALAGVEGGRIKKVGCRQSVILKLPYPAARFTGLCSAKSR